MITNNMMPQVEKWRLEELALLFEMLASILRQGRNPEWAGVFGHFGQEARLLLAAEKAEPEELKRLVRNVQNCFHPGRTLPFLALEHADAAAKVALIQEFAEAKSRLELALDDLERRLVDYLQ